MFMAKHVKNHLQQIEWMVKVLSNVKQKKQQRS